MAEGKSSKLWTLLITGLSIIIVVTGFFVWRGLAGNRPLEIQLVPSMTFEGEIYIGGNVTSPGYYPFNSEDRLSELVRAAGGTSFPGDGRWRLYVSETLSDDTPQLININHAGVWLLKTLPGIGDTRAQAIVDYRAKNGHFRNIGELVNVPGIGSETLNGIRELISVAD
ncbi:MAG: ComEA family DNA-binding protein [Dehalococcoidia bacterium]|jgi:competence ComEA-like helix-hairpin-helix protein|nr:MAG: ComEA family DNA-binding protein [Dehalococcoidia bacterium]